MPGDPPDRLDLSEETREKITAAEASLGELRGITTPGVLPSPYVMLLALMRHEALRTSSLEGTYVTAEQLLLYELDPSEPQSAQSLVNAQREVWNFMRALIEGEAVFLERDHMALAEVRAMHHLLLEGVRGNDKKPGSFRSDQVFIGTDHRFIPPPGHVVSQLMQNLAEYWKAPPPSMKPLAWVGVVHYQFETIHPFRDGNGRIGRALLSLMLGRWCGLRRPWLHLSEYFESKKDEYCDALFAVSSEGDWDRWMSILADATRIQCRRTIERCTALLELRRTWTEIIAGQQFKAGAMAFVDAMLERPMTTVAGAAKTMGVTYPTATKYLDRLVELKVLSVLEGASPRTYMAPRVFRILYVEPANS